ncbi:unnamed protein product [Didymodactylos carnosus]|uniref:ZZ-type domain-containing protein n=1 Tax=Didymodactylos carnosus TaxID=1234261 RepID=A0A814H6V1_9BILA|nr:unnamed protein product [Didymodactylos carnosus]CAF1570054.1 unnamed protein product [Didymodactylos carnosus]CAF3777866.1 unnamed protein product [Didymodactylos carnosus]CAF4364157.1 unnamed protein product [Didymodactylos carnosus]
MVCGRDADNGANVQSGCGTKFNWSQAPEYKASVNEQPAFEQFIRDVPKQQRQNFQNNGITYICGNCDRDMDGILFKCIYCPIDVTYCDRCEQANTLEHHQLYPTHVFKLIMPGEI